MLRRHIASNPVLARRTDRTSGRPGVTMVEMLVVITIIALLASLVLAAVMRTLKVGARTENFSHIGEIGTAIGEAKRVLNLPQIPPGPFTLKNIYHGNEPELAVLLQAWPQLNYSTWAPNSGKPGTGLIPTSQGGHKNSTVTLDSNQTLLFFLTGGTVTNFTGFATNPSQPFAAASVGDNRKGPFLQISTKYFTTTPKTASGLVLVSTTSVGQIPTSVNNATAKLDTVTVAVGGQTPAHAWLVDPYGLPYAYFASLNGTTNLYYAPPVAPPNAKDPTVTLNTSTQFLQQYQLTFSNGHTSPLGGNAVSPYTTSTGFINPQGFQIISPGDDGYFGYGGTIPPSTAEGFDDVSNFSKTTLGSPLN